MYGLVETGLTHVALCGRYMAHGASCTPSSMTPGEEAGVVRALH